MEKKSDQQIKRKEYLRLIMALAVVFLIAGSFILYLAWPLMTGKAIRLATRPVDPFDVFRGQYITINYEISNLPLVNGGNEGNNVYVVLNEDQEKIFRYSSASLTKPTVGIFIKGKIRSTYGNSMNVEYGIEQFFFERNAEFQMRNLTVEAKVDSSGNARISNLLYNDKPVEIKYRKASPIS